MFDRYTADARQVLLLARYEASRRNAAALEPEHLWLALLRQNPRLVKRLARHITPEVIEARLPAVDPEAERVSMTADLPLSAATHRTLTPENPNSQSPIKLDDILYALLREEPAAP